jgi:16S rRNA (adenine1518-N6/adenine1519-N6)-dimethyltransferase
MKAHRPRKRFGQHFLHDTGVIDRIVAAIDPKPRRAPGRDRPR